MVDGPLGRLAARLGVQTEFTDATGVERRTSVDGTLAILRALGVEIDRPDQAHAALASWEKRRARILLPPVLVAWNGSGPVVRVRTASWSDRVDCRLTFADETGIRWTAAGDPRHDLTSHPVHRLPGVLVNLPGDMPLGRHTLRVETRTGAAESVVLAAPTLAFQPNAVDQCRQWGAFLPLYAAWHRPASGRPGAPIGDLGDLRRLAEWAGGLGSSVVSTLPLLATFADPPADPSPYAPVSRLAWSELYIDLEAIPDELLDDTVLARRRSLRRFSSGTPAERVDYAAVSAAKRRVLDAIASVVAERPSVASALEAFVRAHPIVARYARFRAAGEALGRDWSSWPSDVRGDRPGGDLVDPDVVRVHEIAQWLMSRQLEALGVDLRAAGIGLSLDLPIGAHPDGFDAWAFRDVFASGVSVGAPPDAFFPGGQNWGFAPLRPDAGAIDGWGYVTSSLDQQMAVADQLRIDHIIGLVRQFWIPHGGGPDDGAYVGYPADELVAVINLASHRHRTVVLGEDLGTVPPEVRELMARHRFRGSYVTQFETSEDPHVPVRAPRAGQVASWGTHDLPPFAGWWGEHDLDEREDLGFLSGDDAQDARAARASARESLQRLVDHVDGGSTDASEAAGDADADGDGPDGTLAAFAAVVEFLGRSDADLVLVDVEDLLGSIHAQNLPGTHRERENWNRRASVPVEALAKRDDVSAVLARLDRARRLPRVTDLAVQTWLGPDDLHLFNEGSHLRLADKLGAHPRIVDGVSGVQFAVWAPDAETVHVIGDFNGWDRRQTPLVPVERSGIWQGFVPGVTLGQLYKYAIRSRVAGVETEKADPYATRCEEPPRTASVVWRSSHEWADGAWMAERATRQGPGRPMSIYEVHLGSWRRVPEENDRWLTYREAGVALAEYCTEMGFTHVELMPVMEHPYGPSWGYQITGYFAPTSRFGTPDDFAWMVDHLHQHGIGVILDWVPSHFPSDAHGLASFDGSFLYEHADPRRRVQPDWDSLIFNYGRREVQSFLMSNAHYWLERFHVDGLRFDAVASMLYLDYSRSDGEWVPNVWGGNEHLEAIEFLRRLNTELYAAFPDIVLMAEESTSWPGVSAPVHAGGLGFGYKWDLGWMHDTIDYLRRDPIHRRWHHHELTFRSLYSSTEHFVLPLSHDEVVHGKGTLLSRMPGDRWQQFANLRLLIGYQYTIPGTPLLFMGSELGTWDEWSHDRSLPWHLLDHDDHVGLQRWVRHLNRVLRTSESLHGFDRDPAGFAWIDADDHEHSVYAWTRTGRSAERSVVIMNATPEPRPRRVITVPSVPPGVEWSVVANSDAVEFGGSGAPAQVRSTPSGLEVDLPPLGILVLQPMGTST